MCFDKFSFGSIRIDGVTHDYDVVVDRGEIRKRKKKPSKRFSGAFGHTPLSTAEELPWRCRCLLIGTGASGAMPVMGEVRKEAERRGVKLAVMPTAEAIEVLNRNPEKTNAVLHVTC